MSQGVPLVSLQVQVFEGEKISANTSVGVQVNWVLFESIQIKYFLLVFLPQKNVYILRYLGLCEMLASLGLQFWGPYYVRFKTIDKLYEPRDG